MRAAGKKIGRERGAARTIALVWLCASAAALVYTAPLALHWREAIPYGVAIHADPPVQGLVPGDHVQLYYYLALVKDMAEGVVPWFSDPYQFSAPRPNPRRNLSFLPFSALFLAASPLGGAAAYNLLVWLSFPATAAATFALGRRLGIGDAAAAISAAVAALLPFRVANTASGHPAGSLFFLLPLTFYFLERSWREGSRAAAAGAGLVVAALATNEPHYIYFLAFLLPVWVGSVLWRSSPSAPRPSADEILRSSLVLFLAALGPAVYYASYASRHWHFAWDGGSFCLLVATFWAILWCAWKVSGEMRARAGTVSRIPEAASYLPLLVLALYPLQNFVDVPSGGLAIVTFAAVAFAAAKRPLFSAVRARLRRADLEALLERGRALWPFALGLAVALGFIVELKTTSLAASVAAGGRSFRDVMLFSPRPGDFLGRAGASAVYPGVAALTLAAAGLWSPAGRALALIAALAALLTLGSHAPQGLPLYRIAFEVVPYFSQIRQSTKFFAIAGLALALGAGFGVERLQNAVGGRLRFAVFAAALAAVLVDFANVVPLGLSAMPIGNRVYSMVAERGKGTNLLELPLWPGDSHYSSVYLYWALQTKVPTVNGYNPTVFRDYIEHVDRPLETLNLGEMTESQYHAVSDLGVKLVTLHSEVFPPKISPYPCRFTLSAMRRNPNLELLGEDQGIFLFALRGGEYRPFDGATPSPLGAFFEAENLLGFAERVRDPEASGGVFVRGGATRPPLPVVFGPHRTFPRGHYRVRFRTRGPGRVEVTASGARELLASRPVSSASFEESVVGFELTEPKNLEFRAWPTESGVLDVDWVLARKLDRAGDAVPGRIEAEDLRPVLAFDQESPEASGDAFAIVGGPAGSVVRDGPYRYFRPGRLRVSGRGRRAEFAIDVESADGRRRYAELVVPASESWTTAEHEFELPAAEVLCARIVSRGRRADADWVELRRVR